MKPALRAVLAACALAWLASISWATAAADLALSVELDPSTRHLHAVAELDSSGDFTFALHASLAVQTVSVDGHGVGATSSPAGGGQRVWRIASSGRAKLRIEYAGTLPSLDARDHREVMQGLPPMSSAKGAFLPAGSGWYPQPSRAFSYTVRLTLPGDQRGLVAGRIVAEQASHQRYTVQIDFPHPAEGIDLMAGPYVIHEKRIERPGAADLRLRTYFYPELEPLAAGYLEDTARYIALYSKAIGPYPYDAFSIVASPLPTGFGMSTLTYLGAEVLKLPFIRATSLGHEVLHNWWGNGVRVDYAGGNWSEGLTTFMADYDYKERESAGAARDMRLAWLRDFAALPEGSQLALRDFQSRTHGAEAAVGYGKAAMVFFMLRDAIGAEAFERGVRAFYAGHRFKAAGWDDLRAAFEQSSGRTLRVFFDQWVNRGGGPDLSIAAAHRPQDSRNTGVTVTLTQKAPPYVLDVPLAITAGDKTGDRIAHIQRERQNVQIDLAAVAQRVRLDPDLRLWRRLAPVELSPILRQWILASAPRLLIVSADNTVSQSARDVALSFFEREPRLTTPARIGENSQPVLVAGLHAEVDEALVALGAGSRPATLAGRGSAQVWTVAARGDTPPLAVISARDAPALRAVGRALPHLGSQSYLVFDGARVVDRGVWPAQGQSVTVSRAP